MSSAVRVAALAGATHPGPALAVTTIATLLAAAAGQSAPRTLLCAAMVLTGQLSIGWSNDALDRDRDVAAHRADKPVARGDVSVRAVWSAAVAALTVTVPLSLAYGVTAGALHLLMVACGWAYNLGVKATVWSWVPYAVAFGALPACVVLGVRGAHFPPAWATAAGGLLGVGAHVTNVIPDIDEDVAAGVRGLPQRLGVRRATGLGAALLLAANVVLVAGPPGPVDGWGVAVLAVAVTVLAVGLLGGLRPRGRARAPFLAAVVVALLDVAVLVARGTSLA